MLAPPPQVACPPPRRRPPRLPLLLALLGLLCAAACRPRPPAPRLPNEQEADTERPLVHYGPRSLRVFPAQPASGTTTAPSPGRDPAHYLVLASERPELPAAYRPLAVTTQQVPDGYIARAGHSAWVTDPGAGGQSGHVIEAPAPSPADDPQKVNLLVYDRDARVGTPTAVPLPVRCTQSPDRPALLQASDSHLFALVRCPQEGHAILLRLDGQARLQTSHTVPGATDTDQYLHGPDGDYLAVGAQLLRIPPTPGAPMVVGEGIAPAGPPDTRDLLRIADLLLVIDGRSRRAVALDAVSLTRRFSVRFPTQGRVLRLRAAAVRPDRICIVTAEQTSQGQLLLAIPLSLSAPTAPQPDRLLLGQYHASTRDHELVPLAPADGGGALLIYSHPGHSGPLVALRRLTP